MDETARKQFEEQIEDLNAQIAAKTQQTRLKKLYHRYKGVRFIGLDKFHIIFIRFCQKEKKFLDD